MAGLFAELANQIGESDRAIARLIGKTAPEISRWRAGKASVPAEIFEDLLHLTHASPSKELVVYTACFIDSRRSQMMAFLRKSQLATSDMASAIEATALSIHLRRLHLNLRAEFEYLRSCYVAVARVVHYIISGLLKQRGQFADGDNLQQLVRHPYSLIVAELIMQLGLKRGCDTCQRAHHYLNESIQDIAFTTSSDVEAIRLKEYGIHILLRTGGADALNALSGMRKHSDPFVQRAYLLALPRLGYPDETMRLLSHIQKDTALGHAIVHFERLHYGDVFMDTRGNYRSEHKVAINAFKGVAMTLLGPNDPERDEVRKAELVSYVTDENIARGLDRDVTDICRIIYEKIQNTTSQSSMDRQLLKILKKTGMLGE